MLMADSNSIDYFPEIKSFYTDDHSNSCEIHSQNDRSEQIEQRWNEKYAPKRKEDLAVSKCKVNELSSWFDNVFNRNSLGPFLLLKGPTGCGKTAAIKVLCDEFKVELIDCIIDGSSFGSDLESTVSQTKQFELFITKNNMNHCLTSQEDMKSNRRLLMIEEFPNAFYYKTKDFHRILIKAHNKLKSNLVPIVFVISESANGHSDEFKLLPKDLQNQLNFNVINFKPITANALKKTLNKLCNNRVDENDIRNIIETCSGDIRSAINTLEIKYLYLLNEEKNDFSFSTKHKAKKRKICDSVNSKFVPGGRDGSLDLLHVIGKILYAKRVNDDDLIDDDINAFTLPVHLHNKNRKPLLDKAERLIDQISISGETLISWLHKNYIEFIDDIDQAVDCLNWISQADSMSFSQGWFHTRNQWDNWQSIICTRGLMYNLPDSNLRKNHSFKPLIKPAFNDANKFIKTLNISLSSLNAAQIHSNQAFVVDVLPFVSQNKKHLSVLKKEYKTFIDEIVFSNENHKKSHLEIVSKIDRLKIGNDIDNNIFCQKRFSHEQSTSSQSQDVITSIVSHDDYSIEDSDSD